MFLLLNCCNHFCTNGPANNEDLQEFFGDKKTVQKIALKTVREKDEEVKIRNPPRTM